MPAVHHAAVGEGGRLRGQVGVFGCVEVLQLVDGVERDVLVRQEDLSIIRADFVPTLLILSKLTTRPSLNTIGGWSTNPELSKLYNLPSLLRKFGNCDGKTSSVP